VSEFNSLVFQSQFDLISSAVCGIPRWFDNHWAFTPSDSVGEALFELLADASDDVKFRLYKYYTSSSDDYDLVFVYLLEPDGSDVELVFTNTLYEASSLVEQYTMDDIPQWDPYWCLTECVDDDDDDAVVAALSKSKRSNLVATFHLSTPTLIFAGCVLTVSILFFLVRRWCARHDWKAGYHYQPLAVDASLLPEMDVLKYGSM
jgi:hypothetical protein